MKTLICVTICLFSLCQAFPAGEVSTQDQAQSSQVQNVAQGRSLKAYLKNNQKQHKQQILHVIKAYASPKHVERWYNLSRSDRVCISNATRTLGQLWISGSDLVNTQDDWITHLKLCCPNASPEIDEWNQEGLARRQQASANWTENYKKLPQSVQNLLTNLNETFDSLRRDGALIRHNQTEIQDALLPVVKEFLAIPQADWDQVAEEFPRTENILGKKGNLTEHLFVLVRALEEYLVNGTVTNLVGIFQAKEAFSQCNEETFIPYALDWKEEVDSAPEQEFSQHAQNELESSVHSSLVAAEENAPSS